MPAQTANCIDRMSLVSAVPAVYGLFVFTDNRRVVSLASRVRVLVSSFGAPIFGFA